MQIDAQFFFQPASNTLIWFGSSLEMEVLVETDSMFSENHKLFLF